MNDLLQRNCPQKFLLLISAWAMIAALVITAPTSSSGSVRPLSSSQPYTERAVFTVEGMHCDSCAAGVKAMLKRTPGVISADVSYAKKEAVVDYDQQKTTPEKIIDAINKLGYKASLKSKA